MKELAGLRVSLLKIIDVESGTEPLCWEVVLVLCSTKYEHNGGNFDNLNPKPKYKAVRFQTNLKGLLNIRHFIDGLINDTHDLKKEVITPQDSTQ